jgi:hypothetical protein
MSSQKNALNSSNHHAHDKETPSQNERDVVVNNFIKLYDARVSFFTDTFIKKVQEGNRKALAELQRHPLPPTQMDLRQEFAKCLKANIPDEYAFLLKDGKFYTMQALKQLVPEWSAIAEKALMESDPALADKLMSPAQWNAKSAFEVTFVSAANELKDLKKAKKANGHFDHYMKWTIGPLKKAMEQVKAVNPPGNSLIGYGNRISLSEAMAIAESLQDEFQKVLAEKAN